MNTRSLLLVLHRELACRWTSSTMPRTADKIVIWDESGKNRLRKFYLTMHLKEAYAVVYSNTYSEEERFKK